MARIERVVLGSRAIVESRHAPVRASMELRDPEYAIHPASRAHLANLIDSLLERAERAEAHAADMRESIRASRTRIEVDDQRAFRRVKFWTDRIETGAEIRDDLQRVVALADAYLNSDAKTSE